MCNQKPHEDVVPQSVLATWMRLCPGLNPYQEELEIRGTLLIRDASVRHGEVDDLIELCLSYIDEWGQEDPKEDDFRAFLEWLLSGNAPARTELVRIMQSHPDLSHLFT